MDLLMDQPFNEPFIGPCTSHLMNHLMGHGADLSSPLTPHQTVWPIQKTGFKHHLMDH
jgi:hypothetical protein